MMVLGVCGLGVAALYLVPGIASVGRVAAPAPASELPLVRSGVTTDRGTATDQASVAARSAQPSASSTSRVTGTTPVDDPDDATTDENESTGDPADSATSGRDDRVEAPPAGAAAGTTDPTADATEPAAPAAPTESTPAAPRGTPFEAGSADDRTPPDPVEDLAVRTADPDQVQLGWSPAPDQEGTIGYRVWLNGYEVRNTSDTEVTLDWFNDDSSHQVVVVRAVDAAGNQSRTGTALVLTRPDAPAGPEPSASTGSADPEQPATGPSAAASSPASTVGAGRRR